MEIERMRGDMVKLWNDEVQFLMVSRVDPGKWEVNHYFVNDRDYEKKLKTYATAAEAVEFAKRYLVGGKHDLDKALEQL